MDTQKELMEYDESYKSTTDFMKHDNDENVKALSTSIFRNSTRTSSVLELLTLEENHGISEELYAPRCNKLDLYNQEEIEYLNHLAISKALILRMESLFLMLQLEVYLKWLISVSTK